jgi:hypothetical protein
LLSAEAVTIARFDLSRSRIARLGLILLAINVIFTAGTALFIREWSHLGWHGASGRWFVQHVLVQFHLATENVVAAWYSSMLLLSVGVAALLAFVLDHRSVYRWGWLIVLAAFAGLSLDELGSLHERLGMLHRAGADASGWVYVLVVPIAAVALFMTAFAWFHLRRVPAAAGCFVLGTALFLSDPVFELIEMSLLRTGGAHDLFVHNALLVVEEGIVELGGALCFLLGVLVYIRRTRGEGPHTIDLGTATAVRWQAAGALVMTAGVPAAHWFVARWPAGDSGIPDNWFPAATLFLAALLALGTRGARGRLTATVLVTLSAAFGASIYGYSSWFIRIGYPGEALDAAVTAVAAYIGLALSTEH